MGRRQSSDAHGYGDGNGGLIVDLPPGPYRLLRHELAAPWDPAQALVVMYLGRA